MRARSEVTDRLITMLIALAACQCSNDSTVSSAAGLDSGLAGGGSGGLGVGGSVAAGGSGFSGMQIAGGTAGSSGGAGQGGAASRIDGGAACSAITLSGSIGGVAFEQTYVGGTTADFGGQIWELRRPFGAGGLIHVVGTEFGVPDRFVIGSSHAVRSGYFLMPSEGPYAGSFLCVTQGSTIDRTASAYVVDVHGSKVLGQCPGGTPVAGQIDVCSEYTQSVCPLAISGSIESIPLEDAELTAGPVGGDPNIYDVTAFDLMSTIIAPRLDGNPIQQPSGSVTGGFITTAPDGPHGGNIYCIGGGTYDAPFGPNGLMRFTATNLSRLGACGPADGTDRLHSCIPAR